MSLAKTFIPASRNSITLIGDLQREYSSSDTGMSPKRYSPRQMLDRYSRYGTRGAARRIRSASPPNSEAFSPSTCIGTPALDMVRSPWENHSRSGPLNLKLSVFAIQHAPAEFSSPGGRALGMIRTPLVLKAASISRARCCVVVVTNAAPSMNGLSSAVYAAVERASSVECAG